MNKHNINNVARYDSATGTTIITVTRRDGTTHDVIMDTWVYCLFPDITLHVKPMRAGMTKFYPACYFEGKLTYLHKLLGESVLDIAALQKDNDRTTVDHRNRNSCDCRVENLRAANNKEQRANQSRHRKGETQ